MTIGIPRALIYWKRPNFWEVFFHSLGFKILLSPPTNKEIVAKGTKISDPEACFATKVYFGHILWLEGKVDYIFVPRLKTNEEKLEYCPKFFALPDLAKLLIKSPILVETFDERKEKFKETLKKLGKKINKNSIEVERAAKEAFLEERKLKEKEKERFFQKIQSKKQKIILISHPYNLYDEYINLRIKEKLERLGVETLFIEEIPVNSHSQPTHSKPLSGIKFHWEFGKEIMEKIREILKYDIAGAIEISSFACGCDAVLKEFVEKEFKESKIPFLYLIIDEHTGDAGFQTRLEAFIDTLH